MTLSEKLQNLRRAAGFSQEALAEQLGVTRQAVSKWETGEGKPDIDNLLPLAKLLHTTVDYLLDDSAQEPQYQAPPQSQSVGRELWEQTKIFARRWGWLGGYVIAAMGVLRLVPELFFFFTGSMMLGDIGKLFFGETLSGMVTGFGLAYYAVGIIQILFYLAMIVGGIWLAKWLRRKYAN